MGRVDARVGRALAKLLLAGHDGVARRTSGLPNASLVEVARARSRPQTFPAKLEPGLLVGLCQRRAVAERVHLDLLVPELAPHRCDRRSRPFAVSVGRLVPWQVLNFGGKGTHRETFSFVERLRNPSALGRGDGRWAPRAL